VQARRETGIRRRAAGHAAIGVIAALTISLCCGQALAQSKLAARYALSLAGLTIGEGEWNVDIGKDRYVAASSGRFFGMWRLILGGDIFASTHGTMGQARLVPSGYTANFSSDEDVVDVRMGFQNGVVSALETKPPPPAVPDGIPVSPAHLRGAVDPLTAGLIPVPGTADVLTPAVCQHTLPIFDGSHRFDAALSFKRMDNVTATAGYQGAAVVCAMTYRPIAGYRPGAFRVDYLQKNRDMEMWFAPIAGTRVVAVVRISVPTTFGTVVLAATRFEAANREP
jgi:hypothetical protein